jgi:hypothetical protein
MARKPLTAKSKLLGAEGPSSSPTDHSDTSPDSSMSANERGQEPVKREKLRLTSPKRKPPKIKNFRFTDPDLRNLRDLVRTVQEVSPHRQITETGIVKALLILGKDLPADRILAALKETL